MLDFQNETKAFGAKKRRRKLYTHLEKSKTTTKPARLVTAKLLHKGKICKIYLKIVGFVGQPCAVMQNLIVMDETKHVISSCDDCYDRYIRNGFPSVDSSSMKHFVKIHEGSNPNEIYMLKLQHDIYGNELKNPHVSVLGEWRWKSDKPCDEILKIAKKQQAKFYNAIRETQFEWMKSTDVPREKISKTKEANAIGHYINYWPLSMSAKIVHLLKNIVDVLVNFEQMNSVSDVLDESDWKEFETCIRDNVKQYPMQLYQFFDQKFMFEYCMTYASVSPLFAFHDVLNVCRGIKKSIEFLSNRHLHQYLT